MTSNNLKRVVCKTNPSTGKRECNVHVKSGALLQVLNACLCTEKKQSPRCRTDKVALCTESENTRNDVRRGSRNRVRATVREKSAAASFNRQAFFLS